MVIERSIKVHVNGEYVKDLSKIPEPAEFLSLCSEYGKFTGVKTSSFYVKSEKVYEVVYMFSSRKSSN